MRGDGWMDVMWRRGFGEEDTSFNTVSGIWYIL